jgi:hypothetical protein
MRLVALALLIGCPDPDNDTDTDTGTNDVVRIGFSVDDTANQTYTDADALTWKGSFVYDAVTRGIEVDGSWSGPWPVLFDDGSVADGGHEPDGAVAGDHVWGIEVLFPSPSEVTYLEYGLIRGSDAVWLWEGPNGEIEVPAGATGSLTAPGLVLPEFGNIELQFRLDVSNSGAALAPDFQGASYTDIKLKANVWGWVEYPMRDDGLVSDSIADDDVYSLRLSDVAGPHDGLAHVGDDVQFVFVLDGVEYKAGGVGATEGASAFSCPLDADCVEEVLAPHATTHNPSFVAGP